MAPRVGGSEARLRCWEEEGVLSKLVRFGEALDKGMGVPDAVIDDEVGSGKDECIAGAEGSVEGGSETGVGVWRDWWCNGGSGWHCSRGTPWWDG